MARVAEAVGPWQSRRVERPLVSREEAELLRHLPLTAPFWASFVVLGAGTSLFLVGMVMLIVYGHAATGEA